MSKFSYKSLLTILFFLLIGIIVLWKFVLPQQKIKAAWWNDSWNYRQAINISSHTAAESNVYIITTVSIGTTTKTQADDGDFRFIDQSGQILNYYIASGVGTTAITFHIQFSSFPAGAQTIYAYYGNQSAPNGFSAVDFASQASNYAVGSYNSEESNINPIAYWRFDEGVGTTTTDSSGNSNVATINGGTWQAENQCIKGKCLSFNGVGDYAQLPMVNNIKSISMWVFINSGQTGWKYLLDARNGLASGWFSGGGIGGNWTTMYVNGINKAVDWTNIPQGQWAHLYLESNTIFSDDINLMSRVSNSEVLGGKIDEVKFYSYSRSANQILEEYNSSRNIVNLGIKSNTAPTLSSKLVAHYKFDEGSGNKTYNSVGNTGLTGTLYSSISWASKNECKSNNCVYVSDLGTSAFTTVRVPDSNLFSNLSQLTVSAWIKTISNKSTQQIIYKRQNGGTPSWASFVLQLNNNRPYFIVYDTNGSGTSITSQTAIETNKWYHLTAIYNGSQIKIYINGVQAATPVAKTGIILDSDLELLIGGLDTSNTYYFNGYIDDTKIYNSALSADEIKQDYNQGSAIQFGSTNQTIGNTTTSLEYCIPGDTSACSAPIAEWNFEENTGTIAKDTSGNNNNFVFNNGTSSPTWTSGRKNIGSALSFNGISNFLDKTPLSPSIAANTDYTQCLWFYPTSSATRQVMIDDQNQWEHWIALQTDKKIFACYYNVSQMCVTSATAISLNTWNHVCLSVQSGQKMSLYLNGLLTNTNTNIASTLPKIYDDVCVGSAGGAAHNEKFTGKIDGVKIYNYARTPGQIAYDYNKGGPIGWWKFDECQGLTAFDSSGLGNTGAIIIGASGTQNSAGTCQVGTSAAWTNGSTGKINSSLNFDGKDDYINAGNSDTFNYSDGNTFSMWINGSARFNEGATLLNRKDQGNPGFYWIMIYQNKGFLQYWNGSGNVNLTTTNNLPVSQGQWFHYIITISGETVSFYVNGKFIESKNATNIRKDKITSNLYIGSYQQWNSNWEFQGQIDDVRIYNYALTAEQVKVLYNGGAVSFN